MSSGLALHTVTSPPPVDEAVPFAFPVSLSAAALAALPELRPWLADPATAAWAAPFAPTVTAAAAAATNCTGAGGGVFPPEAVRCLRHAITFDHVVWPQKGGGGAAGGGGADDDLMEGSADVSMPLNVDEATVDADLGPPAAIKSMMNVPVAAVGGDGATILGITVCEEMLGTGGFAGCGDGLGGDPAGGGTASQANENGPAGGSLDGLSSLGLVGRWSLRPADGTLAYVGATVDGENVIFSLFSWTAPTELRYVVSLLQRPTIAGGEPLLVHRLSVLLTPAGVTGGGGAGESLFGSLGAAAPPPPALAAALSFFGRELGTYGAATVASPPPPPPPSSTSTSSSCLGSGQDDGLGGGGGSAAGVLADVPCSGPVLASVMRLELASASVVARLRSLALGARGVHPGGLRMGRPAVRARGRGGCSRKGATRAPPLGSAAAPPLSLPTPTAGTLVSIAPAPSAGSAGLPLPPSIVAELPLPPPRIDGGTVAAPPPPSSLSPLSATTTPTTASGTGVAPADGVPLVPAPPPPPLRAAVVDGRAGKRSRVELAAITDPEARARIIRNREAARRSNAKRKARADAARTAAAEAAAAWPLAPR